MGERKVSEANAKNIGNHPPRSQSTQPNNETSAGICILAHTRYVRISVRFCKNPKATRSFALDLLRVLLTRVSGSIFGRADDGDALLTGYPGTGHFCCSCLVFLTRVRHCNPKARLRRIVCELEGFLEVSPGSSYHGDTFLTGYPNTRSKKNPADLGSDPDQVTGGIRPGKSVAPLR